MARTAKKTDQKLWDQVKQAVTAGDKGGEPGQWSARKAQMAVTAYKQAGGGYEGGKAADNHLSQWTDEKWGTQSGQPSGETGERYLPEAAREALTPDEYARSSAKKRQDSRAGRQHSKQPADVARKTAQYRDGGEELAALTRAQLMQRAAARHLAGRSRLTKPQLVEALRDDG